MENNNHKIIRKLFKDNNFAVGDSNFLITEYIEFFLNNVQISDINYNFTSSYDNQPNIKNVGNIAITDINNEIYSFSIRTNGLYKNVFDNSDVPFTIYYNKFDENNNLIMEASIYSGNQFENIGLISISTDNYLINCKSNNECLWNTLYAKTDLSLIDKETNSNICEIEVNTTGNKLNERLDDLFEQVNNLTRFSTRTRK